MNGKLIAIRRILGRLHAQWEDDCKKGISDGCHKSSEGYVSLVYPKWYECRSESEYVNAGPIRVEIYSYLFGPHRQHEFGSLDEALSAVTEWENEYQVWREDEQMEV